MSAVEIPIRSKLDPQGFRDLDANLARARTQAVGFGKAAANAIGASTGPAGELISQINAVAGSMDAVGARGAIMATGVGVALAGTTLAIKSAAEAYEEMSKAQDDATESSNRFEQSQAKTLETLKKGVLSADQGRALGIALSRRDVLESRILAGKPGSKEDTANRAEFNEINKEIARLKRGETSKQGEARFGMEALSVDAKKAIEEQGLKELASKLGPGALESLKESRDFAVSQRQGLNINTRAGALEANRITEALRPIESLIDVLEAKIKADEARTAAINAEENQRPNLLGLTTAQDATTQASPESAISAVMTDARQRIGGSANAPILSTWKTMSDLQKQTAANTAAIARNTSRTTPASNPVSPTAVQR